ncbi:hypothetical protein OA2633_10759 [Oceanicaulis alexandrii HTCC2633]|uniref:hypothetical protein n=1 Tax=Oceanicaulis sp. HTCC2633 TaxID=314254 RepID=UPI000066D328|nr:hypothetical protein [Oceanicaulis sp. HTCC2633]EAP88727.1 hypothetical protein OA2633_10759 [Oceanicaulis alexandrii HTCC2633] [Oceanicaulis sp. HTCC2633]
MLLMVKSVLASGVMLATLGMCSSVQIIAPYDASLEQALSERNEEFVELVAALESDLSDGVPAYAEYEPRYIALAARLETASTRARLTSLGAAEPVCALPEMMRARLEARLGASALRTIAAGSTQDEADEDTVRGCTARLMSNVQEQFSNFTSMHYCASVSRPEDSLAQQAWDRRCPDGRLMLNTLVLETASGQMKQTLEYAWAVELAKKPSGEES